MCETGTGDDAEERKNEVGDAENQIHRLQRGIGRIHIFCGYAENFIRSARELHNAVQSAYDRIEPECEVDEEMKPFQSLVFCLCHGETSKINIVVSLYDEFFILSILSFKKTGDLRIFFRLRIINIVT